MNLVKIPCLPRDPAAFLKLAAEILVNGDYIFWEKSIVFNNNYRSREARTAKGLVKHPAVFPIVIQ